ncbi:hypothetical protein KNT81_gp228 [Proteus phage phiP4-3]|uniref:Uncharacterized protein n=1 Tax=Proteus phage phiP4-3 TaxID=2065203 RepID=A0A2I6PFP4_9CAUD|nr:hypothetical protein KNT81_gp228 [Proteus phage phiP4-3]AUM58543.1 hypothetical protein phiP43_185 [Proteus phage phiP4-3]AZV01216.1 hypothetical protein vBSdyM006_079 [Shigella phage vB_SdyM_006]
MISAENVFYLNKKVAEKLGLEVVCFKHNFEIRLRDSWIIFNPCFNVEQALPIMSKHNISINFEEHLNPAAYKNLKHVGPTTFTFDLSASHENVLIAAMMVFIGA